jgi:hypothetical protein
MTNAREELVGILDRVRKLREDISISVRCASIKRDTGYWDNDNYVSPAPILLKEGYSLEEYKNFLDALNFEYDSGYGGQELHGTVWLTRENTWLSRGEYDGSEWWEYNECPKVPDELKREDKYYMSTL